MTFDQYAFTRIDIHTLTVINVYDLKGSQPLDLHYFLCFQRLLDQVEYSTDKRCCLFLVQTSTIHQ